MHELFLRYLLSGVSMSMIALGLLAVLPRLRSHMRARSLYAVLLMLLLGFLIPIRPAAQTSVVHFPLTEPLEVLPQTAAAVPWYTADASHTAQSQELMPMQLSASAGSVHVQMISLLAWIWAIGALGHCAWQIARHRRFVRAVRRLSTSVQDPALLKRFHTQKALLGIRRTVELRCCPGLSSPLLFGLWHPTILLPEKVPADVELILRHELTHIAQWDGVAKALMALVKALHWYNPVPRALIRAASLQCEIACDTVALEGQNMTARERYAENILAALQNSGRACSDLSTGYTGGKKDMKKRLLALTELRPKRTGIWVFVAVLAVSLTLCGIMRTRISWPLLSPAQAQAQSNWQSAPITEYVLPQQEMNSIDDEAAASAAVDKYLTHWSNSDYSRMAELAWPVWRDRHESAVQMLFYKHALDIPREWIMEEPVHIDKEQRSISMNVTMARPGSSATQTFRYDVLVYRVDGVWYVDPDSWTRQSEVQPTNNTLLTRPEAPSSTPQIAASDENMAMLQRSLLYAEYAPHGLAYDPSTDRMYYQGQLVRYFLDIVASNGKPLNGGEFSGTVRSHTTKEGAIDVYTLRDETGKLIGITPFSQEEFDARTLAWSQNQD